MRHSSNRILTTHYDGANRIDCITDSDPEQGRTEFVRDHRGNATQHKVKLAAPDSWAVTTTDYDHLLFFEKPPIAGSAV